MLQLRSPIWKVEFFTYAHFLMNALANLRILTFVVGLGNSCFEECFSQYPHFGKLSFASTLTFWWMPQLICGFWFSASASGTFFLRNSWANILILESRVFHRISVFDECLCQFAPFGFEAFFLACKKWRMLQLISSLRKVDLFDEAHFLTNASDNLLSLALKPWPWHATNKECLRLFNTGHGLRHRWLGQH